MYNGTPRFELRASANCTGRIEVSVPNVFQSTLSRCIDCVSTWNNDQHYLTIEIRSNKTAYFYLDAPGTISQLEKLAESEFEQALQISDELKTTAFHSPLSREHVREIDDVVDSMQSNLTAKHYELVLHKLDRVEQLRTLALQEEDNYTRAEAFVNSVRQEILSSQGYLSKWHKTVAVCRKTADECRAEYGIPPGKISVIYNGVDVGKFGPKIARDVVRDKYSLGDKPVILSVGCGTIRKGTPYLLRSMRDVRNKIPSARLIVVGPSKYKDQMISSVKELGIEENVIFSGAVPREELPYYYSACDVVAVPSLQEGFPIVLLEAMATGRPVVASRVGGIPEAVEDNRNGILFEPGNVTQLTSALISLLEDESSRKRMGREARHLAETRYDWKEIAHSYLVEFKNLL